MSSRRLPSCKSSTANNTLAGEEFSLEAEEDEEGEGRSEKRRRGLDVATSFFPWSSVIRHCVRGVQDVDQGDADGDDLLMLCTRKGMFDFFLYELILSIHVIKEMLFFLLLTKRVRGSL